MKRPLVVLLLAMLAVVSIPAHAAEIAVAGEALTGDGQCLAINGATSDTTGRSRWLAGYWSQVTTAPVCSEEDPHFDPVIVCIKAEVSGTVGASDQVTTISIGATGPSRSSYLIKIVDRPQGTDAFGVLQALPTTGPCGASAVTTTPVSFGGFIVAIA